MFDCLVIDCRQRVRGMSPGSAACCPVAFVVGCHWATLQGCRAPFHPLMPTVFRFTRATPTSGDNSPPPNKCGRTPTSVLLAFVSRAEELAIGCGLLRSARLQSVLTCCVVLDCTRAHAHVTHMVLGREGACRGQLHRGCQASFAAPDWCKNSYLSLPHTVLACQRYSNHATTSLMAPAVKAARCDKQSANHTAP